MSFRQDVAQDLKWRERRRGVRLNSAVPVAVDWTDGNGTHNRLQAKTRIVSPCGCLVVLPENLALDMAVDVINLATKDKCAGSIVWHGKERVEGFEIGIELINPGLDFWCLDL